jgi:hypothetical protein
MLKNQLLRIVKKFTSILFSLLISFSIFGQNFAVIDASYPNAAQAKARFNTQRTYLVNDTQIGAPTQISKALEGKQVTNLHIFVSTEPGSMAFCNMDLNADNLKEEALTILQLASHVTDSIVIHSQNIFLTEEGRAFKIKLEQLTGLNIVVQ